MTTSFGCLPSRIGDVSFGPLVTSTRPTTGQEPTLEHILHLRQHDVPHHRCGIQLVLHAFRLERRCTIVTDSPRWAATGVHMDIEALRARIPTVATLRMIAFKNRTSAVAEAIGEIVAEIERDGRQPNAWESDNLLDAMDSLRTGNSFLAAAHLEFSLATSENHGNTFTVPRHERTTVNDLKQRLRRLRTTA